MAKKEGDLEKIIIKSDNINEILKGYVPKNIDIVFLKSAEMDYPKITGKFYIPGCFYFNTKDQKAHFTAVEMVMCLNQLGYIFFNEIFKQNLIQGTPSFNKEEYKNWLVNGFLLTGFDNIRFKKPIDLQKEFEGELIIDKIVSRDKNSKYFVKLHYEFDKGKVIGEVYSVLFFH